MPVVAVSSHFESSVVQAVAARFESERCVFEPMGLRAPNDCLFAEQPFLLQYIASHDLVQLRDPETPGHWILDAAIRALPEYDAYCRFVRDECFFFSSFRQSGVRDQDGKNTHYVTDDDVKDFILVRLKERLDQKSDTLAFTVRLKDGPVAGYTSLFNRQYIGWHLQAERSAFISPELQGTGLGKEALVALTRYAFEQLGVDQIFTKVDPANTKSRTNIETNFGAVFIGEESYARPGTTGLGDARRKYMIYPDNFYDAIKRSCDLLQEVQQWCRVPVDNIRLAYGSASS